MTFCCGVLVGVSFWLAVFLALAEVFVVSSMSVMLCCGGRGAFAFLLLLVVVMVGSIGELVSSDLYRSASIGQWTNPD